MKPSWVRYEPIPRRPFLSNVRWDRVADVPWTWVRIFYKWLFASQEEVTPSQVANYISCPQKYKYTVKDRRPSRPSGHLAFHNAVHRTVMEFHRRFQGDPAARFDDLLKAYQENWDPDPFADDAQEKLFYDNGVRVLERFFNENKGAKRPDLLRRSVDVVIDGIPLKATVDRIDKISRKHWVITVYKTGQRLLEGSALMNDLKSQLLYLMIKQKWPRVTTEFYYEYLDAGKRVKVEMRLPEMAGARRRLREANRGMSEQDYPTRPSSLCGWCDFQSECPAWRGYVTDRTRYRLSYSKMMTYVRCPRNFKFLYVDGVAPLARNFFSIGTTIHNALEDFFNYDGLLKQPSFEYLVKLYKKQWVNAGYEDEEDERKFFMDGLKMLWDYYRLEIDGKFKKAWATEPYFELPVGEKFVMIGFIDRVDRHEDGSYEVLDYKTEPKIRTQEEVDEDLQLTIYYWACIQAFGVTPSKVSLYFTRHNKKIWTTRDASHIKKLTDYVNEVGGRMLTETAYEPQINKYCSSCDHLKGCPKEDEVLAQMKAGKMMHKAKPVSVTPGGSPAALLPEEQATQEKAVEQQLEKSDS